MTSEDATPPGPDWMHVAVELPMADGLALLMHLREKAGFKEIDWCELQRPDRARATYGPCPPRTSSGYTIDPFPRRPSPEE